MVNTEMDSSVLRKCTEHTHFSAADHRRVCAGGEEKRPGNPEDIQRAGVRPKASALARGAIRGRTTASGWCRDPREFLLVGDVTFRILAMDHHIRGKHGRDDPQLTTTASTAFLVHGFHLEE
jgi:hypothetical protein